MMSYAWGFNWNKPWQTKLIMNADYSLKSVNISIGSTNRRSLVTNLHLKSLIYSVFLTLCIDIGDEYLKKGCNMFLIYNLYMNYGCNILKNSNTANKISIKKYHKNKNIPKY